LACKLVVLVGSREALEAAIQNDKAHERDTSLRARWEALLTCGNI